MSGSTIHAQHRSRSPLSARLSIMAVLVALGGAALVASGTAASDPGIHGPGSPEWTRHLELEYGPRSTSSVVPHGPGSPEWTRHLELEYGM